MSAVMIDIETLSTAPNATILTIAAQPFDPLGSGHYEKNHYWRLDLESQADRHINDETIGWWGTQPEAASEAFHPEGRVPLRQALHELRPILWNATTLWSQGSFDFVIIENAYTSIGESAPWQFWKIRDSRTVISLYPDCPRPTVAHTALEDCRSQIQQVQTTLRQLGVREMR